MKKIIILSLFFLLLSQCETIYQDEYLIVSNRVGNLIIGKSKATVLAKLKMYDVKKLENDSFSSEYYNVYDSSEGSLLLSLEFLENSLWAIQAHSDKYHTSKGLSPKDTFLNAQVKEYYSVGFMMSSEDYFYSQKDEIIFYFEKKMDNSGEVAEDAKLLSITTGHLFNVSEIYKQ